MRLITLFDGRRRREIIATGLLVVATLWALRFDYTYSMLPYNVKAGDTLETILDQHLFHNPVIANASIDYISATQSAYDVDYVMKNIGREGGYRIEVWFNQLSIYGPNNAMVVRSNLLVSSVLLNHLLQVAVHNLVVIVLAGWAWLVLKEYDFRLNTTWRREVMWPSVALIILAPVLFIVVVYTLLIIVTSVL